VHQERCEFDIISGLEAIYKERALKELGKEWLVAPYEPQVWGFTDPADTCADTDKNKAISHALA
jgi:hypothetical protein